MCGNVIIQKGVKVSRLSGTESVMGQCALSHSVSALAN